MKEQPSWWTFLSIIIFHCLFFLSSFRITTPPWNLPHFSTGLYILRLAQVCASGFIMECVIPFDEWKWIQCASIVLFTCSLALLVTPQMTQPKIQQLWTFIFVRTGCILLYSAICVCVFWVYFQFYAIEILHTLLLVPYCIILCWFLYQVYYRPEFAAYFDQATNLTLHSVFLFILWSFCLQPNLVSSPFRLLIIWWMQTHVFFSIFVREQWLHLFWGVASKHEDHPHNQGVETYIQTGKGFESFKEHCSREFSVENIWCYYALEHLQQFPSNKLAVEICQRFIECDSPSQINISQKLRDQFLVVAHQISDHQLMASETTNVIRALKEELVALMQESFHRFRVTSLYSQPVRDSGEMTTELSSLRSSLISLRSSEPIVDIDDDDGAMGFVV